MQKVQKQQVQTQNVEQQKVQSNAKVKGNANGIKQSYSSKSGDAGISKGVIGACRCSLTKRMNSKQDIL